MTVQELMDISPWCERLEVVVRKEGRGQWLYAFRVAKNAEVYPSEVSAEVREMRQLSEYTPYGNKKIVRLKDGDVVDVEKEYSNALRTKVISKDPHRLDPAIGNLEICSIVPRGLPRADLLTEVRHSYDVNCYPPEDRKAERIVMQPERKEIEESGQMCLEDFLHE